MISYRRLCFLTNDFDEENNFFCLFSVYFIFRSLLSRSLLLIPASIISCLFWHPNTSPSHRLRRSKNKRVHIWIRCARSELYVPRRKKCWLWCYNIVVVSCQCKAIELENLNPFTGEHKKKKWINIIQGKNIQRNRFDFIIDTRKKGHLMFYYLFFPGPGEVVILLHLYWQPCVYPIVCFRDCYLSEFFALVRVYRETCSFDTGTTVIRTIVRLKHKQKSTRLP